jgi:integrase/recombinase XerD
MTHLRKMMLEELERRNYAQITISSYIRTIEDFARYFRRPPDQLAPEQSASTKHICSARES